jgi:hypothetical protein
VQLSAVLLARVLGFVEAVDLNPRGTVFFPELTEALVERFKFQKFPRTLEEFDETKGVVFEEGVFDRKVIQKMTLWTNILVVETRSNTDDSKQILEGILTWGAEKFALNYKPGMIKRFGYVSDLTFHSEAPLLAASSAIKNLADKNSKLVSEIWQELVKYEGLSMAVGHDPMSRQSGIAAFTIQRRGAARFSENKFFSEAPLLTDTHIRLLEEYEREVLADAELRAPRTHKI